VVIRTDFSDDAGWLDTLDALEQAPEDGEDDDFEFDNFVIDDPSWAEATPDEILEVVRRDQYLTEYLSVFLVADKQAVSGEEHLLLVVTASDPQDEMYDAGRDLPRLVVTPSAGTTVALSPYAPGRSGELDPAPTSMG